MSRFGEHVRSTAFSLTLSYEMIKLLMALHAEEKKEFPYCWVSTLESGRTFGALERRGLIEWHDGPGRGQ
jgi:isopentenyldiphosphate isomerase